MILLVAMSLAMLGAVTPLTKYPNQSKNVKKHFKKIELVNAKKLELQKRNKFATR